MERSAPLSLLYHWWSMGVPRPIVNMKTKTPSSWQMPHGKRHHRKELFAESPLDRTGSLDSQRLNMVYTIEEVPPGTCAYFWGCRPTWQASAAWSLHPFYRPACVSRVWPVGHQPVQRVHFSSASVSQVSRQSRMQAGDCLVKGARG